MSDVERDTIIDGECIDGFGKKGILLKVDYKKSRIQLSKQHGLIWFDIESAHGLSMAPENHAKMGNDDITRWVRENIKGKPIEILSHIKIGFTPELKVKYERVLSLLRIFGSKYELPFKKFVNSFLNEEVREENLYDMIRQHLGQEIFYTLSALNQKVNADKIPTLVAELIDFTSDLMHHFGFNRRIIIPAIGRRPDPRFEKVVQGARGEPRNTISIVLGLGLIDTHSNQVLKKAQVMIYN